MSIHKLLIHKNKENIYIKFTKKQLIKFYINIGKYKSLSFNLKNYIIGNYFNLVIFNLNYLYFSISNFINLFSKILIKFGKVLLLFEKTNIFKESKYKEFTKKFKFSKNFICMENWVTGYLTNYRKILPNFKKKYFFPDLLLVFKVKNNDKLKSIGNEVKTLYLLGIFFIELHLINYFFNFYFIFINTSYKCNFFFITLIYMVLLKVDRYIRIKNFFNKVKKINKKKKYEKINKK